MSDESKYVDQNLYVNFKQSNPITDYGSPEEEAMKAKIIPFGFLYSRMNDLYFMKVRYHDKPEGEDLFGKLIAINRWAYPLLTTNAVMMGCMHSDASTYKQAITASLYYLWPGFAAATTFATVTYFSTNIRKKDDT